MLEIKNITKIYETEGLKQKALDHISVNFRSNEFASILGPSGSGKTTLLNIIGGLDQYTTGDLIINEVSTKMFQERDWDSYRNHRVGFVFQSYNLISHQSILSNVELALTLSGIGKKERIKKAKEALKKVGLKDHMNKRPNQLSGGQMQRVAIARALVNDPEILLADEPTGALDSATSLQIMDLLKEIAKDRLVIMVTHNPELAQNYSTRIIELKDGKIISDNNPYDGSIDTKEELEMRKQKSKKTSMSLKTALSLSLNNLMTKKGRTLLTSFAGSIGIIGIALILSLSNGVQEYIKKTERETLSSYPISIEAETIDFGQMIMFISEEEEVTCKKDQICTVDDISSGAEMMETSSLIKNNLTKFKTFLDDNGGNIKDYVTDIKYYYDIELQIFSKNHVQVNPNTFSITGNQPMMNEDVFEELIDSEELLKHQYQVLAGRLPNKYNELVLIVDENNQIPLSMVYALGLESRKELTDYIKKTDTEKIHFDSINYTYQDLLNQTLKLVLNSDYYKQENGRWIDMSTDSNYMNSKIDSGLDLKIVGILKIGEDTKNASSGVVGYTHDLIEYVIEKNNQSQIGKEQLQNKEINIFTKTPFDQVKTKYEENASLLGIASLEDPVAINIYPKDFDSKERITAIIDDYNHNQTEENQIEYNDMVRLLLSGITTIVNVISYVLIAFVAVSLIVSSIMIAIITYISVLERTKEIGILRAIGASRKDVSRVFNAETIIEGFIAGLLGVGIAYLITIPINLIVKSIFEINQIAHLSIIPALILILISVLLTVFAGLFPSRMASKKDPVESLRSE